MLQGRGRHGKFDGALAVLAVEQGIDQAAAEAVTAAEGGLRLIVLKEAAVAVGSQVQYDLSEGTIRLLIVIPPYLRTR